MAGRKRASRGFLITFEGGEGAGKSTQMRLLKARLRREKIPVIQTLQPGGTPMGKHIREALLNPRWKVGIYSSRAELLLYAADRAQHVEEVIRPAMGEGKVVICDRYEDSTNVYQGIARKLGLKWTQQVNDFATGRLHPNLVIILDIPTHVGLGRVRSRVRKNRDLTKKGRLVKKDRLERESLEFHERVRKGFLRLAKQHPRRYAVVDATHTVEDVAEQIEKAVFRQMGKRSGSRKRPGSGSRKRPGSGRKL